MRFSWAILLLFFVSDLPAATAMNLPQDQLNKSFGICHMSYLESGNEYIYKQCSELVFEQFEIQIKSAAQNKKGLTAATWNEFYDRALSNRKTCFLAAHQTQKNHTLLRDLTMCDLIFHNALLDKALK